MESKFHLDDLKSVEEVDTQTISNTLTDRQPANSCYNPTISFKAGYKHNFYNKGHVLKPFRVNILH